METSTRIIDRLREYFRHSRYPIVWAYLFGSEARGQATPLSDLDIAIYLDEPDLERRLRAYPGILLDLVQATGKEAVDLVILNDAKPRLARHILEGQLLYTQDEKRRIATEARTLAAYSDERDMSDEYDRYLQARIRAGRMGERTTDMIDKRIVLDRLAYIQARLASLKGRRNLSLAELMENEERRHATLYELQTCLEAMTDIGNHLIAALGLRKPEERTEVMAILADADILPKDLARQLRTAIAMRNALVHGYLTVAIPLVYRALQDNLGDIEDFCKAIVAFMDKLEDGKARK
jgi:uncharacterized protein YutE (UPF0331/DUF86 family)/predicted nucleotidyltransferase